MLEIVKIKKLKWEGNEADLIWVYKKPNSDYAQLRQPNPA